MNIEIKDLKIIMKLCQTYSAETIYQWIKDGYNCDDENADMPDSHSAEGLAFAIGRGLSKYHIMEFMGFDDTFFPSLPEPLKSNYIAKQYCEVVGGGDIADSIELANGQFIYIDSVGVGVYASREKFEGNLPLTMHNF